MVTDKAEPPPPSPTNKESGGLFHDTSPRVQQQPEKSSSSSASSPSWRHHQWSFADYQTCGCSSIAPLVHLPVLRLSSSSRKCTAQFIVRLGSLFHLLGGSSLSFRSQPSMEGGKSRNGVNHGKGKGGTISFPRRSLCGDSGG
ncbi:hypothetical protein ZWY2020_037172 [Hordeum vulgare]|nr:hypothetical protein ZWY2020_037172 [Hordeum vulgare]